MYALVVVQVKGILEQDPSRTGMLWIG